MDNTIYYKIIDITFIIFVLTGCHASFPNDPNNTLDNIIKTKTLKIGICHSIPYQEKELLGQLARTLNAKMVLVMDNQENLYRSLEQHQINIVSCSIQEDTPWNKRLSLTKSFLIKRPSQADRQYVFAVQQGENRWLSYVNDFIHNWKSS